MMLNDLAGLYYQQGDLVRRGEDVASGIQRFREVGDTGGRGHCLEQYR